MTANQAVPACQEAALAFSFESVALSAFGERSSANKLHYQVADHIWDQLRGQGRLVTDAMILTLSEALKRHGRNASHAQPAEQLELLCLLAKLDREGLQELVVAAAETIKENYASLSTMEGGPANLLRRLEDGLGGDYPGYSAGAFIELEAERDAARDALIVANERLINAGMEPVGASGNDILTPRPRPT